MHKEHEEMAIKSILLRNGERKNFAVVLREIPLREEGGMSDFDLAVDEIMKYYAHKVPKM